MKPRRRAWTAIVALAPWLSPVAPFVLAAPVVAVDTHAPIAQLAQDATLAEQVGARESIGGDPLRAHELAVEAYRAGDALGAEALWRAALAWRGDGPARIDRARVLYNLGNAAYRQGKALEAVAWYTEATRERPRFDDAWANLEFARSTAGLPPADRGDLTSTLQRLAGASTPAESEWFVLVCTAFLAGALGLRALRGGAGSRALVLFALAFLAVSTVPWIASVLRTGRDRVFVVSAAGAELRSEPRADAVSLSTLSPGSEAERVDELAEWMRVELSSGPSGWLERSSVLAPSAERASEMP